MSYTVVIEQDGETARLDCATLEEAQQVRLSFVNYGKCSNVYIEQEPDCYEQESRSRYR